MRKARALNKIMLFATVITILYIMAGDMGSILARAEPGDDTPHPASIVNMTSLYMNEKGSVRAYHRDIIFQFVSWDNTTEKSYLIMADNLQMAEGNFTEYKLLKLTFKMRIVRNLRVYINENLSLHKTNMIIYNQDYYYAPDDGGSIKFLGYTWDELVSQRWLIFRAVLVGSIISLFMLGRIGMYYWRRTRGEEIIVSSH